MKTAFTWHRPSPESSLACAVSATLLLSFSTQSQAVAIDTGNPDVTATWDNTVKYSNAWRRIGAKHRVMYSFMMIFC